MTARKTKKAHEMHFQFANFGCIGSLILVTPWRVRWLIVRCVHCVRFEFPRQNQQKLIFLILVLLSTHPKNQRYGRSRLLSYIYFLTLFLTFLSVVCLLRWNQFGFSTIIREFYEYGVNILKCKTILLDMTLWTAIALM